MTDTDSETYWLEFYQIAETKILGAKSTADALRSAVRVYAFGLVAVAFILVIGVLVSNGGEPVDGATALVVVATGLAWAAPMIVFGVVVWAISYLLDLAAIRVQLTIQDSMEEDDN